MSRKSAALPVLHVAEPPAAYLGRPPIVVDCSVLTAALFEEELRDAARRILVGKSLQEGVLQAPLATFDAKLAKAAREHLAAGPWE